LIKNKLDEKSNPKLNLAAVEASPFNEQTLEVGFH